MTSVLIKEQKKVYGPKVYKEGGETYRIKAVVRYDDQCGNGHNTFSITGSIDRLNGNGRYIEGSGGCIHEDISKHFPELEPFIKWHLVSSDGPMHYVTNTIYHSKTFNYDYARSCAVWPEATDEELTAPDLEARLIARLPKLMEDFKRDVESLGFVY